MKTKFLLCLALTACSSASVEATSATTTSDLDYDQSVGAHIASVARRVDGRASGNMCLAEVQNSLERAGVRAFPRLPGAVNLDDFMQSQGSGLSAWGFEKQARSVDDIPLGSIIAWRPGQCGYSAQYGHIEIAIGGGRACSDFCGNIAHGCGAPNVYVPIQAKPDGKLHIANRVSPIHAQPNASSPVVDTLRTTYSWFSCWATGEMHSGGNTTWYFTRGDDNGKDGFVPASALDTTSAFDANPTIPKCP